VERPKYFSQHGYLDGTSKVGTLTLSPLTGGTFPVRSHTDKPTPPDRPIGFRLGRPRKRLFRQAVVR
jgi:hypothetical protein